MMNLFFSSIILKGIVMEALAIAGINLTYAERE